jgi:hypothetical protein
VRIALLGLLALALTGCGIGRAPLLSIVDTTAPVPSPGTIKTANRLDIHYRVGMPAQVTSRIRASDGTVWTIYDAQPRPTAGEYVLALDGTVAGPDRGERRALADGEYQVLLTADGAGEHQELAVTYTVSGADTTPPEIENLTLLPDRISPNFDALDDVTQVTYRLTKTALVAAFADRIADDGTRQQAWRGEQVMTEVGEQSLQWDGVVNGQPLPAGRYEVGIRAEDAAGNVSEGRHTVTIEEPGVPDATIVTARITPSQLVRGGQVCADVTVRNAGATVLRTQGPDSSYVYNSFDSFSSILDRQFVDRAGYWRVGLAWSGTPDPGGATYPYRWGFGHDLQPGEQALVHGCVEIYDQQSKMVFFASLVQEKVAIHDPGVALTPITITP